MSSSPVVATVARSALLLAILIVACEPPAEYADLVLTGGKVVTVDDASPEAEALAVTGYTITAVGTNEDIAHYVGPRPGSSSSTEGWRSRASSKATATTSGWGAPR